MAGEAPKGPKSATKSDEGDDVFSSSAPGLSGTKPEVKKDPVEQGRAKAAPAAPESDDELIFTDEVGGAPGSPASKAAPAAAPNKPVPGATTGTTNRLGSGSQKVQPGTRSSDRVKAVDSGLTARGKTAFYSSSDANQIPLATSGTKSALGSKKKEEPQYEECKTGAVFGEFKVGALLSEEAGARVWNAERTGRACILRDLALPGSAAADLVARGERLLQVRHEDLEPLLGVGRSRAGAWFAVEQRSTLRAQVKAKGPLGEAEAFAALARATRAAAALNARNLPHGDISPGSLLADSPGLKLGSPVRARYRAVRLQAGSLWGDARYAAPEVLDGQPPTAASDVFALGLTFAFLISGSEPVEVEDPCAVMFARMRSPRGIPEVGVLAPQATEAARAFYHRMTAADPTRRPSLPDLSSEIDAFLGQGRVPVLAPEKPSPLLKGPAIRKEIALAFLAIALAVAAICVYALFSAHPGDPTQGVRFEVPVPGK